jgi:hypothetical protein
MALVDGWRRLNEYKRTGLDELRDDMRWMARCA